MGYGERAVTFLRRLKHQRIPHAGTRSSLTRGKKGSFGASIRRVVSLRWDVLTEAQADAIENWILGKGGDTPFLYALRGDTARQWTCERISRTRGTPNTVGVELRESFALLD
jgi:hypothetical protein